MSVQAKTQDIEIVSNSPVLQTATSNSKIVELNGKKREVERIRIDDPTALDAEIEKNQSLKKSEQTKEILWMAAALIAGVAVTAIGVGLLLTGGPLWLGFVTKLTFFCTFFPLFIVSENHKEQKRYYNQKILELQTIQKDLKNEEFRLFAKSYFGDALELNELLKVHDLFQKSKALNHSVSNFYKELNSSRDEICPGTGRLFSRNIL